MPYAKRGEQYLLIKSPPASEAPRFGLICKSRPSCRASYTPLPDRTRKALPGGLTVEQQDAVKALVKSRVEILPHDAQKTKAAITC